MPRDLAVIVLETEGGEPISVGEIQEIEGLFVDILFDAWLHTKTSSPATAAQLKGAA